MNIENKKIWGIFFASVTIFVWGVTFVSTKYLLNDFSSLEILFFRYVTAYIGLWLIHPKFQKIQMKDNILYALAGLTGVVLYQLSENIAIHFTNASNVSVIVSICPLFTAIISQIFLKERHLSVWFVIGFIIAISGVALVCFNGKHSLEFNPKGDLLALMAAISWGFYSLLISIINKKKYDRLCSTRRIFFFAVLIMIPLTVFGWNLVPGKGDFVRSLCFYTDKTVNVLRFSKALTWINIIFLGVVASGICFTTWSKACDIIGTVKVSCGLYLIPVVTVIFAFLFLGEKLTLLGALGTVITITGLFISERK
ncbi:MAG: DMT family transporter [Treponema sp.]|uniref:DMT family transporter n=1 Tax=Treponema sp. TaxID=166 RepID=UPI001B5CE9BF|nr:DMT family transporter [Treponema sp.]MBP5402195.1 DMT family transporter [Treponema sp.]MBR5933040.1 DMT family transporter [Treponema sp.]